MIERSFLGDALWLCDPIDNHVSTVASVCEEDGVASTHTLGNDELQQTGKATRMGR